MSNSQARLIIAFIASWNGSQEALRAALPEIYTKIYRYNLAKLFFDGVSIQKAETIKAYYNYIENMDSNSKVCLDFQSSLYVLQQISQNGLISDSEIG